MKKNLFTTAKYLFVLGIAIGMLWLAFKGVDLKSTLQEMLHANMFWVLASVLASLIAFVSRSIRWNMLIEPLGYRPALGNTNAALMIGYLANLAVPRLGEVTRCGTLNRSEKVPFDALLGTVIIERIIDVLCLLVCMISTAVLEYDRLGSFLFTNIFNPLREKAGQTFHSPLLFILIAVFLIGVFVLIRISAKKNPIGAKIASMLKGLWNGLSSVRKVKKPGLFLFHTVLIWTMYFMMSYSCFNALAATSDLGLKAGLFVLVAGAMGMSAPVQGGIGTYHLLVSQGLMLYGLSQEHGLAYATLLHTSQTLVVILFGGIAFLYLFLKRRNEHTATTSK